jgi:hypothetical protein
MYYLDYDFDWDEDKDKKNYAKHGIRFTEAKTIWYDHNALEVFDDRHSVNEERWIRIGLSKKLQLLVVVYSEVSSKIVRIISARHASATETEQYLIWSENER